MVGSSLLSSIIQYYISAAADGVAKSEQTAAGKLISQANSRAEEAIERTAEANVTIAQLNLQIQKFKMPRSITIEQANLIYAACKPYKGTIFDAAINEQDAESMAFETILQELLKNCGWIQVDWSGNNMQITRKGSASVGSIGASGVAIVYHGSNKENLQAPAEALAKAITNDGISAAAEQQDWQSRREAGNDGSDLRMDVLHVIVGQKVL